ncbi:MAG: phosphodiesterase [Pseudomonadota bacterium]
MTKLLAFTDTHLRSEGETIIGLDPYAKFAGALEHAQRRHPDATRIVVMGDLVNSGKAEEYERFKQVIDTAKCPVTIIPGNHDDRNQLVESLSLTRDDAGYVQSVFDTETHRVIAIDTVFGEKYLSFASLGQYNEARLKWLDAQLAAADKPVLLFAHHPPFKVGFDGMDDIRMRDDEAFADVVLGRVAHIICGHVHRTISGNWRGLSYSILKSTCHQMPLALGDAGMSLSTDEPSAYGVILLSEDNVIVHTEDWELAKDEFFSSDDAIAQP